MSKGTLPVPHIIAIVLGIIVLALLGYWLFTQGGIFGSVASEQTCNGKLLSYCTFWSLCNYQNCMPGDKDFYTANKDCEPYQPRLTPKGKAPSNVEDECKIRLKQGESTPATTTTTAP